MIDGCSVFTRFDKVTTMTMTMTIDLRTFGKLLRSLLDDLSL